MSSMCGREVKKFIYDENVGDHEKLESTIPLLDEIAVTQPQLIFAF